ncbi:hypothetical protein QQF64_009625 [Cirrhinus molitorella]|uniref:Uncharacterized protein n=1 Tax=Cirrhinus molitorella TaxID=172907 RepID=A0ABR3M1Q6_9TELE
MCSQRTPAIPTSSSMTSRHPPGVIVRQRPYRVPEACRHAIEKEIQKMLKLGVIEPSRSPWSSPIVLVPKPDGTLRFCNDYRHLNEISDFDSYPMPRVSKVSESEGVQHPDSLMDEAVFQSAGPGLKAAQSPP